MNPNTAKDTENEEIDLGMISKKIGGFFSYINSLLFRALRFIIKNIIVLSLLFIIGVSIGIYMDRGVKTYDHQIIVKPNFNTADYLYLKIELLDSKIKEGDTIFLQSLGIQQPAKLLKIEIEPIIDVYQFISINDQNFQLLKLMAEDSDIKKIVEDRTTSKNYQFHTIKFSTKELTSYKKTIEPLMNYLNQSAYFEKIQTTAIKNLDLKIKANEVLISQIDTFLNGLSSENNKGGNLVFYKENSQLNEVILTKDGLVKEQGNLRMERINMDHIIKTTTTIANIENKKTISKKMMIILPLLFILMYVAGYFFIRFYKTQSSK